MPNLIVKWGREKLNVDADLNEAPILLKSQLYALTGVLPERQKVFIKGRTLGDDDWNGIKLNDGAMIMMVGSVGALPQALNLQNQSTEAAEADIATTNLPVGLKNFGNTCYMNATLQCLKVMPEVKEALIQYSTQTNGSYSVSGNSGSMQITKAVGNVYRMLESGSSKRRAGFSPSDMLSKLHNVFPHFAARDEGGNLIQQDANECWVELVKAVQSTLRTDGGDNSLVVEQFMEGSYDVQMKNLECEVEPVVKASEKFLQLSCFLNQEIKYLESGMKSTLKEEVDKYSEVLGRNARYEKKALMSRLPAYLSVQMVRFYYKERDNISAKILKDVKFPLNLDVADMCTANLQSKFIPMRQAFKADEDKKLEQARANSQDTTTKALNTSSEEEEKESLPFSFEDDPGSNNSGFYELMGVITHKGRSSTSGHYVAWARMNVNHWAMCDDDEVHPVTTEQVLNLSGGGDWHCAYLLLYGPKVLKKDKCQ